MPARKHCETREAQRRILLVPEQLHRGACVGAASTRLNLGNAKVLVTSAPLYVGKVP